MKLNAYTMIFGLIIGCVQTETTRDGAAEVRAAIAKANQAFVVAVRSGNADGLSHYYSKEELAGLMPSLERARAENRYSVSELQDVRWGEVHIQGETAQVETFEKWQHTHYAAGTNECLFVVPSREVRQTYHLNKTPSGWVIADVVDDPGNEPAKRVACR